MQPRRSLMHKADLNGNPGPDNFEPRRSLRLKEKAQANQAESPVLKNVQPKEPKVALFNTNRKPRKTKVYEASSNSNPEPDKFEPRRSMRLREKAQTKQTLSGSPILKNVEKAVTKAEETALALLNTNRMSKIIMLTAASSGNQEPEFEQRKFLSLRKKSALCGSAVLHYVQKEEPKKMHFILLDTNLLRETLPSSNRLLFTQEADRGQVYYRYPETRKNILPVWHPVPVILQAFQDRFSGKNQKNNYNWLGFFGLLIVIIIAVIYSCFGV